MNRILTCNQCGRKVQEETHRLSADLAFRFGLGAAPVDLPVFGYPGWTYEAVDLHTGRVIPFRQAAKRRDHVEAVWVCDGCQVDP